MVTWAETNKRAFFGMAAAVIALLVFIAGGVCAAAQDSDVRSRKNEVLISEIIRRMDETNDRLERLENKIDRLLEERHGE